MQVIYTDSRIRANNASGGYSIRFSTGVQSFLTSVHFFVIPVEYLKQLFLNPDIIILLILFGAE